MKNRLNNNLTTLLKNQFFEFWYFYIGAIICLYFTHSIQSLLPFYAKELSVLVTKDKDSIEIGKFFLLALGIIIFRSSSRLLFFYPARVLQRNLRTELLSKLEKALPIRYEKFNSGALFQILGSAMDDIRGLVGFALLQIGNIIIALVVLLPKLIEFNSDLVFALTPLLIGFIIFSLIVRTNAGIFKEGQENQAQVQNQLMESYQGKETIKNYFAENSFFEQFKDLSYRELYTFYKAGKKISFSLPLIPLGLGLSLVWGAYTIQTNNLGASSLILFIGFIYLFSEPMMFLAWIGVVFARAHGAWSRINELLKSLSTASDLELYLRENNKEILASDERKYQVLFWDKAVQLSISPFKWTIFVSETGHGKTQILKQISNISSINEASISYVGQSPYLYDDTLLANITLGIHLDDDLKEKVYHYLCLFELDFLAYKKEDLFEMQVGENGKRLSGGQVKRICLIRSLISDAELIIWDDPFSSVDLILERKILNQLQNDNNLKKKTFLLSGHRLSLMNYCHDYYLIDKSEGIIESGPIAPKIKDKDSYLFKYFEKQIFENNGNGDL